jgi:HEAT repeat protein
MKKCLLLLLLLGWLLAACGSFEPPAKEASAGSSGNTASGANSEANSSEDVHPSPEEILQEAGVPLDTGALAGLVLNEGAEVELRYWAAIALGRSREAAALPTLVEALKTAEPDVRYGAVLGIAELGAQENVPLLAPALQDASAGVRIAAVNAIGRLGGQEAAALLAGKLLEAAEAEIEVRLAAATALGWQGDPGAVPALEQTLGDGSAKLRAAAAISLAELGASSAVPALVSTALDPMIEEWQRVDAIGALEKLVGQSFNYTKPNSAPTTEAERRAALNRINNWWQANAAGYPER